MKVIGSFNNISEEMKAQIPQLQPGEIILFKRVDGVANRFPDDRDYRERVPFLYNTAQIPTRAKIRDWATGAIVEVGVPDRFNSKEVLSTRLFMPGLGIPKFNESGLFALCGDNVEDVELYEYLYICPFNDNPANPYPERSIAKIFKEVDAEKDSQEEVDETEKLLEALQIAKSMDETEMQEYAGAMMWPDYTPSVLKGKILAAAKADHKTFLKQVSDEGTKVKAELKLARDKGIIEYDVTDSSIKMGNSKLVKNLDVPDGNYIAAFYSYLQVSQNGGEEVLKVIRRQLGAKPKTAKAKEEKATATV